MGEMCCKFGPSKCRKLNSLFRKFLSLLDQLKFPVPMRRELKRKGPNFTEQLGCRLRQVLPDFANFISPQYPRLRRALTGLRG